MEVVVTDWWILVFLFHYFLHKPLPFRGGLGTGPIDILAEKANESDGPVFWSAQEALDKANTGKREIITISKKRGVSKASTSKTITRSKAYLIRRLLELENIPPEDYVTFSQNSKQTCYSYCVAFNM